jgi:hypothetical protein
VEQDSEYPPTLKALNFNVLIADTALQTTLLNVILMGMVHRMPEKLRDELPELPAAKRERFEEEYGLGAGKTEILIDEPALAEFFEEDVNIDLATLVALVDPIMIAAIAVAVAFVLVAFYLPLFSMAAKVQ